jgi:hypothetical protein
MLWKYYLLLYHSLQIPIRWYIEVENVRSYHIFESWKGRPIPSAHLYILGVLHTQTRAHAHTYIKIKTIVIQIFYYFTAYQSWYLIPCCGLEVQEPTQALKSVKGQGNTFDLNPKWARTLPSLIYFSWDIYRDPPPQRKNLISPKTNFKYQSWYLTPCCGFEVQKP